MSIEPKETKQVLTIVVSESTKASFSDIAIEDGQLVFMQDKHAIALDYKGRRSFYNQIETINTEQERKNLEFPRNGVFYFVLGTAVLWYYDANKGWMDVTTPPSGFLFISDEDPEIGSENVLYVNKANRYISIWDGHQYIQVSNYTESLSVDEINNIFKK